jgi:hypothetical protein
MSPPFPFQDFRVPAVDAEPIPRGPWPTASTVGIEEATDRDVRRAIEATERRCWSELR